MSCRNLIYILGHVQFYAASGLSVVIHIHSMVNPEGTVYNILQEVDRKVHILHVPTISANVV
jgi:hypothetical protein